MVAGGVAAFRRRRNQPLKNHAVTVIERWLIRCPRHAVKDFKGPVAGEPGGAFFRAAAANLHDAIVAEDGGSAPSLRPCVSGRFRPDCCRSEPAPNAIGEVIRPAARWPAQGVYLVWTEVRPGLKAAEYEKVIERDRVRPNGAQTVEVTSGLTTEG